MTDALKRDILAIPTREERIGGQTFKYVKLHEVIELLDTRADTATPAPAVPTVKSLVWDGFRAGPYWIEVKDGGLAHLFCDYDRDDYGVEAMQGGFLTLVSIDDLKAAAQADYESRILSAITMAPADPLADGRVVALIELVQRAQLNIPNFYGQWHQDIRDALAAITATEEGET